MRAIFIFYFMIIFAGLVHAAEERIIMVDRCEMKVIVVSRPAELQNGLLGQTERTFHYDGMLFAMQRNGRKYFHTMGMRMNIRLVGVVQLSNGDYSTIGSVIKGTSGLKEIIIDAPDVLEIPENKWTMYFQRCIKAKAQR
ncbi:hypothetical protein RsTz2092_08910 [Deferribacterales bacterium RsTz2092]|nr:hypothetical protein AGMMS49941_06260 [Deferribacterales bacterium]